MEELNIWEYNVQLYDHLLLYKCLCQFPSRDEIQKVYCDFLRSESPSRFDGDVPIKKNKLLILSVIQTVGEIYVNEACTKYFICPEVHNLLSIFLSDEFWDNFIHCLQFIKDKHLIWANIKSFCSICYASPKLLFKTRLQLLLKVLERNLFDKSCVPIIEFLTHLVNHRIISCTDGEVSKCDNSIACKVTSIKEFLLFCSSLLSHNWDKFIEQFHSVLNLPCENKSVHQFLLLWKSLCDRSFEENLDSSFLSEQYVLTFLNCAHNLPLLSCRLYVDIIIQAFYLNLKCKKQQKFKIEDLERTVGFAIENCFLDLLPCTSEELGFCDLTKEKSNTESSEQLKKCDSVIMQKVAFILFSIFSELESDSLLCDALKNVIIFMKKNSEISTDKPLYSWILDTFLNQDDVLIGVMLALLKIYKKLKNKEGFKCKEKSPSTLLDFQLNLNPHKIFINFLQRLGYDHNELLAFLTSDETCFLLYLTEYLKLTLKEPEDFLEAHQSILNIKPAELCIDDLGVTHSDNICQEGLSLCAEDSQSSHILLNEKLVSYSSNSSSDDEIANDPGSSVRPDTVSFGRNISSTLSVLVRLKVAILKLVNLGEFPYKASPLTYLLDMCEQHFTQYL